ncbi:MAG: type II secretion system protein [Candidatus Hydrogenedentes bacterium]|nr:type II secretion system protein [Candidatus Hydrogenedentota bacterium]
MRHAAFPYRAAGARRGGWTLFELLVVIAIIGILTGISISVTRMFSRDDMRGAARTIYTMLRAARVYATTYNVETAVVYGLDNPILRTNEGTETFSPLQDTILTNGLEPLAMRTIRSAAVMYRLPDAFNAEPDLPADVEAGLVLPNRYVSTVVMDSAQAVRWRDVGTFVPTPGAGDVVPLPVGYSLLLLLPRPEYSGDATSAAGALTEEPPLYNVDFGMVDYPEDKRNFLLEYNRQMENWVKPKDQWEPSLEKIGMRPVYIYPFTMQQLPGTSEWDIDRPLIRPHIAHVFNPDGSLKTRLNDRERFRIMVGPDPETFPEDRVVDMGDGTFRPMGIFIEINKSTGAVRLGS